MTLALRCVGGRPYRVIWCQPVPMRLSVFGASREIMRGCGTGIIAAGTALLPGSLELRPHRVVNPPPLEVPHGPHIMSIIVARSVALVRSGLPGRQCRRKMTRPCFSGRDACHQHRDLVEEVLAVPSCETVALELGVPPPMVGIISNRLSSHSDQCLNWPLMEWTGCSP